MKRRLFLKLSSRAALIATFANPLSRSSQSAPFLGGTRIRRGTNKNIENASFGTGQTALAGNTIEKFVDPLPVFTGRRVSATDVTVSISEFQQQILPASVYAKLPRPFDKGTFVWGYQVGSAPPNYPGFTIEARRGAATTVAYNNNLPISPFLQKYLTVASLSG